MDEREVLILRAKLSEQSDRFDEMTDCMKSVAETGKRLTNEERNLFSVAYKNKVGARRSSWRVMKSVEDKMTSTENQRRRAMTKDYRKLIEKELKQICYEVLDMLEDTLIPKCGEEAESMVFYLKMKGDYHRYLKEVTDTDDSRAAREASHTPGPRDDTAHSEAERAYLEATRVARRDLASTHPIRLGLALNFSVFYYEIAKQPERACSLAKEAFDTAISELESLREDSYKDSTLIMQLLRDNLTLWTDASADDSGGD